MMGTKKTDDWMEWQAGYACGAILMPVTLLKRLAGEYFAEHSLSGAVTPQSAHGQVLVTETTRTFQVSRDAAQV